MQVTELTAEGLKREYHVVVPASDIEARVSARLEELKKTIKMPGFRPGKVPVTLLRKQYGRSLMGEILEAEVNRGSKEALAQHELRPALQPKIEITAFDEGADLEFKMAVEVLPEVPEVDLKGMELTRPVAEVTDEAVEQTLNTFAKQRQDYEPPEEPRPAREGDKVVVDFQGKKDGEPFEGGKAEDYPLVLGSGSLVSGFESQLVGVSAGEDKTIEVTFPADYPREDFRGQPITFDVHVKEVREPQPLTIDDEFAKTYGFESLDEMRNMVRERLEAEYGQHSRARVKRALLDSLASRYQFEVPPGMVEMEFEEIWKQVQQERGHQHDHDHDHEHEHDHVHDHEHAHEQDEGAKADPADAELRAEYQGIAERRVRLGLLLSAIGQANQIQVESQELNAALIEQARRYPGQEQQVLEYFKNTPQAIEQLRAPIYEDKVVDFILEMATVSEATVTPEELMRDPDLDESETPAEPAAAEKAEPAA